MNQNVVFLLLSEVTTLYILDAQPGSRPDFHQTVLQTLELWSLLYQLILSFQLFSPVFTWVQI